MLRFVALCVCCCWLIGCATSHSQSHLSPGQTSELLQGQRYFETGFYKHAMQTLLPLACDGVPEAQYAVGYMYYYGYGVGQDSEVGRFWIARAANQGYLPAKEALAEISREKPDKPRSRYR